MPTFFRSPSAFHAWLTKDHATTRELLVGFHKKGSGIYAYEQRSDTLIDDSAHGRRS